MSTKLAEDPAAHDFGSLYAEHGGRLWRALLAAFGDPEIASDAVGEAFAQALQRGDEIRFALPWIWKAAFRVAAGEMKRRSRFADESSIRPVEAAYEGHEVLSCLRDLPLNQRGALVLRYYAGYPAKEIARILGSSPGAVRVHLHRGRRRLREMLEADHD